MDKNIFIQSIDTCTCMLELVFLTAIFFVFCKKQKNVLIEKCQWEASAFKDGWYIITL